MRNYYQYYVTKDGRVFKEGKEIKPSDNGRGYKIVTLNINGKRKCKGVHRLVAEVYIPNPECKSDVDHIDCDRWNNCENNLRWVTHGENIQHSYDSKQRSAKGEGNARSILTEELVHEICALFQSGGRPKDARDAGYPYVPSCGIWCHKNWKYISDGYSFN